MRERGRYQIQLMKTRSSSGVGMKIDLEFDLDTLRIRDLDQDQEQDQQNRKPSTAILDRIKRTTNVTVDADTGEVTDPRQGEAIPKIRGRTEGTKLREMLGNFDAIE